jgi:multimeric flavodoxin WrbA
MEKVKILGIAGSPRKNGNTTKMVEGALQGAMSVSGVETDLYELAGKKIGYCVSCYKCVEKGECVIKDDLQDIVKRYMEADGIIWGAPVYHMSIPASMKAVFDRMGCSVVSHYAGRGKDVPRLGKACGVLTNGYHRYGGQDFALNFMMNSCVLMNGVVVSGDKNTGSYVGAAACTGSPDLESKDVILKDEEGMRCAESVGRRVAEMARIIKVGISTLKNELPAEYFYTWEEV